MSINLKPSKVWPTSDGSKFDTRPEAVAHETILQRRGRLSAVKFEGYNRDEAGNECVFSEDIGEFIAKNADAILSALTVKQARAPRKPRAPKAVAAAPQVGATPQA